MIILYYIIIYMIIIYNVIILLYVMLFPPPDSPSIYVDIHFVL